MCPLVPRPDATKLALAAAALLLGCASAADEASGPGTTSSLAVLFAVFISVALTLALIHCFLFLFESRQRLHLYFALAAAAFAAVAFFDYHERLGAPLTLPVLGELQRYAVSGLILASARFTFGLFLPRAPRRFWIYVAGISVLLGVAIIDPNLFGLPAGLLGLVIILDVLAILVRRWRTLPEGAWILGLGAAVFCLGGMAQLSFDLAGAESLADRLSPYLWSGLVFILAISIYLARTFARTARELEQRLDEVRTLSRERLEQERAAREEEVRRRVLEADNRRKTDELEAARALQLGLLPDEPPQVAGLDVAATMHTATEVGGDFYDFQVGPHGELTVVVADAVGHGARAGTLVVAIKSLFQLIGPRGDLAPRLERLGRAVRGMGLPRAHVALTLARFRPGAVEVASAAMPPALIRRGATGKVEEVLLGGMPLGGPDRLGYESRTVPLAPGDVVLLLSDGLPELPDADGEPLGYEGVERLLAASDALSAGAVLDELAAAARARTAGTAPPDDITLVAVRIEAA